MIDANNFMPLISFYIPWKHQENLWFSVFRGYIKGLLVWNGLRYFLQLLKNPLDLCDVKVGNKGMKTTQIHVLSVVFMINFDRIEQINRVLADTDAQVTQLYIENKNLFIFSNFSNIHLKHIFRDHNL